MEAGKVYIVKTTGEQVVALEQVSEGCWRFRRPVMTVEDGIKHEEVIWYEHEVWPLNEHLQQEIDNIKLKHKIQIQLKETDEVEPVDEPVNLSVN